MIDVSCVLCMWKMCCNDIGRMDGQTADINTPLQHMWKIICRGVCMQN